MAKLFERKRPCDDDLYTDYIINRLPVTEIAQKYGVHKQTVYEWTSSAELKRRRGVGADFYLSLLKAYEDGATQKELAHRYGLARSTICRYVARGLRVKTETVKKRREQQ